MNTEQYRCQTPGRMANEGGSQAPAAQFLSGDSHGRALSHNEGGYMYTRGGKLLFRASYESHAIDLWPDATEDDLRALVGALASRLLDARAPVPAPAPTWTREKPTDEDDYWRWEPGWGSAMCVHVSRDERGLYIYGEECDERIDKISGDTHWIRVDRPTIPRIREVIQPQGFMIFGEAEAEEIAYRINHFESPPHPSMGQAPE